MVGCDCVEHNMTTDMSCYPCRLQAQLQAHRVVLFYFARRKSAGGLKQLMHLLNACKA